MPQKMGTGIGRVRQERMEPARECAEMEERVSESPSTLIVPGLLSLTSFRGISPKRESVFLLGTLSPWLSVLPYKLRDEDGALFASLPNTGWKYSPPILSLNNKNKQDRPGAQIGGDTRGIKK